MSIRPHTKVTVASIPTCDLCRQAPAYADGRTRFGVWGYMCKACHLVHGMGLGLGRGQQLILAAAPQSAPCDCGDHFCVNPDHKDPVSEDAYREAWAGDE